ncbi:MAG: AsnC family transcriptional regulator [Methanothrix sp.]|nr:AsnC family transcriptional regulator [Methanothrix sp.]
MDETDHRILEAVQDGFPLTPRPFRALGEALGLEEAEVIRRLEAMQSAGLVRRIGPILDPQRLGRVGVLAAARVVEEEADDLARIINEYPEVSHNYLRPNESGYSLWFTVSASEERVREILGEIESRTGRGLLVLPTIRIFKIGVRFSIA